MGEAHAITDEFMQARLAGSRGYTIVLLHPGPAYGSEGADAIIWEHGRRNFELRESGAMVIVGPVPDDTDLAGIAIYTTDPEETAGIVAGDPAVVAGVLTAEIHPLRSFPGDGLPA